MIMLSDNSYTKTLSSTASSSQNLIFFQSPPFAFACSASEMWNGNNPGEVRILGFDPSIAMKQLAPNNVEGLLHNALRYIVTTKAQDKS